MTETEEEAVQENGTPREKGDVNGRVLEEGIGRRGTGSGIGNRRGLCTSIMDTGNEVKDESVGEAHTQDVGFAQSGPDGGGP